MWSRGLVSESPENKQLITLDLLKATHGGRVRVYHIIWTSHSTTIVIVIMYVCNANVDEELTELNHCRSPLAAMQSCF